MKFTARLVDDKLEIKNVSNTPQYVESVNVKYRVYVIVDEIAGTEAIRNITEEYPINRTVEDKITITIPYKDIVEVIVKIRKGDVAEEERIEL